MEVLRPISFACWEVRACPGNCRKEQPRQARPRSGLVSWSLSQHSMFSAEVSCPQSFQSLMGKEYTFEMGFRESSRVVCQNEFSIIYTDGSLWDSAPHRRKGKSSTNTSGLFEMLRVSSIPGLS